MKKVEGFQTEDGEFFVSEQQAKQHEQTLDFIKEYEQLPKQEQLQITVNTGLGVAVGYASGEGLVKWVKNNKDLAGKLVGRGVVCKI
ncbi:MAG: hypothetical protein GY861_13120 [bacterium]|nr:hypothetical protein [bacterium]